MSKCPCPKHKDSLINYIKVEKEKSKFFCNECLIEEGFYFFDAVDIEKSFKYPDQILIHFNQDPHQQELIKAVFKFDETHFRTLISEYEKMINALKEKLIADLAAIKIQSEELIKVFTTRRAYIGKIVNHDDYKTIITEFQKSNQQINLTAFNKSEQAVHEYFQKLNQQKLAFTLFSNVNLQSKKENLNPNTFPGEVLQIRLKSQEISQYSLLVHLLRNQLLYTSFLTTIEQTITNKLNKKIKSYQQIYSSVDDGLQMNTLWDKIDGKDHLLMFFKSQSLNVFGGYSPCKWGKTINAYVQDNSVASFLFSQTNNQIFPLKADQKQYAIYSNQSSSYGPTFGGGYDLYFSTSFTVSQGSPNHTYQNNTGQTVQLHGTSTTIVECEIYQIIFE